MTESPLFTLMDVTVPSHSAVISFSIFMASRIRTACPLVTLSPTATLMSLMTPGSGALMGVPPAGAAAAGAAAGCAGAAALGDSVLDSSALGASATGAATGTAG